MSILIDSGACCNLIDSSILDASFPRSPGPLIDLRLADSSSYPVSDVAHFPVTIGSSGSWKASCGIAPANTLVHDVILGTPFMNANNVVLFSAPVLHAFIGFDNPCYLSPIPPSSSEVPNPGRPTSPPPPVPTAPVAPEVTKDPWSRLISPETPARQAERKAALEKCSFDAVTEGIAKLREINATCPLAALLEEFKHIFPDALPHILPPDRNERNHTIDLDPSKPLPQRRAYPISDANRDVLDKKLTELIDCNIIARNDGYTKACSPAFLVPGKKPRLVGDYRILNDATMLRAQVVPGIFDIIDRLGVAKFFSLLDMLSGYFQLLIEPMSSELTTFATPLGQFRYNVTAMGLKNAGTDFQRAVAACLQASGVYWKAILNYLDDIVVFSGSFEEHLVHLRALFTALTIDGWFLSFPKAFLGRTKIKILGHIVEDGAVYPDPEYVSNLSSLPNPDLAKNRIKSLQCVLGLLGFYRRFVKDFSKIAVPLTNLLRKDVPWVWGPEHAAAVSSLTSVLQAQADAGLRLFNVSLPTRVMTDASGSGIGAVLEQKSASSDWAPIAFFSQALAPAEASLLNFERELLAIFRACTKWLGYLSGIHFEIWCDCAALCNIHSMPLNARKKRVSTMLLFLRSLSFTWVKVAGKANGAADALSRVHDPVPDPTPDAILDVLPPLDPSSPPRTLLDSLLMMS